jgi:3-dehydroquinate dehydratase II
MKQIVIINGPNLNLLGKRQPEIYGSLTFEEYFESLVRIYPTISLHYFQSNHEGAIIDMIHEIGFRYDGIVINAGAYTHTSIAIMDAILGVTTPTVEVHISNIYEREDFRHTNYISKAAIKSIIGQGLDGYKQAIDYIVTLPSITT